MVNLVTMLSKKARKKLETNVSSYLSKKWWGRWDLNPHGISPNGF